MNAKMRNLFFSVVMMFSASFTYAQVKGEFSTDVTFGDDVSFGSPYTSVILTGEGWELSTNLNEEGSVVIEEAKYSWVVTKSVTLTFGSQSTPYGIAWGLHRPSANSFASLPRDHAVASGVGLSTSVVGVGVQTFYGNEGFWGGRVSYSKWDHTVGVSTDSEESLLVDVLGEVNVLGFPVVSSLEYDLSEAGDGAYWFRTVVTPDFAKGASVLLGYNSDEEVTYGIKYKCSDKCFLTTELSAEGDKSIRVSYTF